MITLPKAKKKPINWRHIFNFIIVLSVIPIWLFVFWLEYNQSYEYYSTGLYTPYSVLVFILTVIFLLLLCILQLGLAILLEVMPSNVLIGIWDYVEPKENQ
jgi:MFS superfamily sulfate permease-like transporter